MRECKHSGARTGERCLRGEDLVADDDDGDVAVVDAVVGHRAEERRGARFPVEQIEHECHTCLGHPGGEPMPAGITNDRHATRDRCSGRDQKVAIDRV